MPISDLSPENIQKIEGESGNKLEVTTEGKGEVVSSFNDTVTQAEINVTGSGVTAFANLSNLQTGNMSGRTGVRIWNKGKRIRWRIFGDLTGNVGEDIGKNEAIDFPYGDSIIIEVREQNSDNEIDIIITEYK